MGELISEIILVKKRANIQRTRDPSAAAAGSQPPRAPPHICAPAPRRKGRTQHPLVAGCHQAQLYTCSRFLDGKRGQSAILAATPASLEGLAGRRRLGCHSGGKTGASCFGKGAFQQPVIGNFCCRREEGQRACASSQTVHKLGLHLRHL